MCQKVHDLITVPDEQQVIASPRLFHARISVLHYFGGKDSA
jgi:hypothetical protein